MINGFHAFARAVGWGTLAGGAPYTMLFIIPIVWTIFDNSNVSEIAILLAYPFVLSGVMVLGSAVIFGLPLTALLSLRKQKGAGTYAATGLVLGALVPAAIIGFLAGELRYEEGLFFALPGALAGCVTGASWGRWCEAQSAAQALD